MELQHHLRQANSKHKQHVWIHIAIHFHASYKLESVVNARMTMFLHFSKHMLSFSTEIKQDSFWELDKFGLLDLLAHKLHLLENYEFGHKTHKLVVLLPTIRRHATMFPLQD